VYTKTGDAGTSSLYNMHREPKDHEYFHALGDTDELNAHVGVGCEHCRASSMLPVLTERLVEVQSRLFDIGSAIATPLDTSSEKQLKRARFSADHIVTLEGWIDEMDEELPALKNFILPSGGLCSAELHVARTVCRRAERRTVKLARDGKVAAPVAIWLNRLSDFFFVAARYAALKTGNTETVYKKAREEVLEVDATADADAST
jgi:ATP:cob(I)alamin adenosyltransferase|tara:strand:- start:1512 stop:2123 length:612 start_codon:yes stop_codon:yes gene_type:complete